MNLGNLLNGKGTYSSGWAMIVAGLVQASSIIGEQLGVDTSTGREILSAVLDSNCPFLVFGGFAIIGFRRKMGKMQRAGSVTPDEAEAEKEAMKRQLKELLNKLEGPGE